ncbi:MAG: oligosaccharide flippase family protein, partial [Phycisphaerae bacterium]
MKRDLIIYAGVIVLGQGLALLVSPFTTRLLSEQQFAALPLLASIYGVVAIIQHAGIDLAFPFFLANAAEKSSRQKIFVTSTLVASVAAVVVWGILTLGASVHSWLREYAGVTRLEILLYLAGLLATMLVNWQIGIMRFHHMVMAYARVALLGTTVATLVAVPLIALVEPAYRLAVVIGIQATMQYAALAWSLREFRRAGARVYARQAFSFDLARRMLRVGIALLPGSVVYGFLVMT